jgi:hypothetical protein
MYEICAIMRATEDDPYADREVEEFFNGRSLKTVKQVDAKELNQILAEPGIARVVIIDTGVVRGLQTKNEQTANPHKASGKFVRSLCPCDCAAVFGWNKI